MIQTLGLAGGIELPGVREGLAAEDTAWVPYPARPSGEPRAGPQPAPVARLAVGISGHKKAPRGTVRSDCGSACTGRSVLREQGVRKLLAQAMDRVPATAEPATRPSTFRAFAVCVLRSELRTVAGPRAFAQIVAPFPPEPLAWCRSRWPLRARQNLCLGSVWRKGLIHHFPAPPRPLFWELSTCYQHG